MCAVLGVPVLQYRGSYAMVMAQLRHVPDDFLAVSRTAVLQQYQGMEREARAIAQRSALRLADPKDILCAGDACLYKANGRALYFDDSHLSAYGASFVEPALEPCFESGQR